MAESAAARDMTSPYPSVKYAMSPFAPLLTRRYLGLGLREQLGELSDIEITEVD